MNGLNELFNFLTKEEIIKLFWIVIISFVVIAFFYSIYKFIKKVVLKKAKTKKQISNARIFLNFIKYLFAFIFILIFVFTYFGSWAELGLVMGLLSVALGFALQKPITNIVAWVVLVVRKPFFIGDRIAIDGLKGDVRDISISYITIEEVGGTIDGEEKSGRVAVLPNSIIFEKEIINYTADNDFIVDEIKTLISYESDLQKAEEIIRKSVERVMVPVWDNFSKKVSREIRIRLKFMDSGINVIVRYNVPAYRRNEISTAITREIFKRIKRAKNVEIAYPHTQVILKK